MKGLPAEEKIKEEKMKTRRSMVKALVAALVVMVTMTFTVTDDVSAATKNTSATGSGFNSAINISLGSSAKVTMKSGTKYFKFTTSGNDSYYVLKITNGTDCDGSVIVYDGNRTELENRYLWSYDSREFEDKYSRNMTHYIRVDLDADKSGPVTVSVKELKDNAGDEYQNARKISGTQSGTIEIGGDEDWFKFTAPKAGTYRFAFVCTGDNTVDYAVLDGNVTELRSYWVFQNDKKTEEYKLRAGQNIYLRLSCSDKTKYKVSAYRYIHRPAREKITRVKAGRRTLTVKYAKRAYATKYQLQVKRAGKSWKAGKTYECGKKLTKRVAKLKRGKKYSVRVRAVRIVDGKAYAGAWSAKRTVRVK